MVKNFAAACGLMAALACGSAAHAQSAGTDQSVSAGDAPVVRLELRSANVLVRTWDRLSVQVESAQPVRVVHFNPNQVQEALRAPLAILSTTVYGPQGAVTLLPEQFELSSVPGGAHEAVSISGRDAGDVTVSIPNSTALLAVHVVRGRILLQNYRGTFVARVRNGNLQLRNVAGTGFAEVAKGVLFAANSAFDRLRARTAVGKVLFERCAAREIEATSISGDVTYDSGTFQRGLARFESQYGNVAIGVSGGGAQLGAHSSNGKIFENFSRRAIVNGSSTDAQATLEGGGPVVTASSQNGSVYLYDGALAAKRNLGQTWRAVRADVRRRQPALRHRIH